MPTEYRPTLFEFARVEGRAVVASFDGGRITSDACALLLGAADRVIGLTRRLAGCFTDARDPALIEHEVETLLMQRIVGLALGDEDLIDHDELRHDPIMAVLAGKLAARRADCAPPRAGPIARRCAPGRLRAAARRADCAPLAGKSTLNRLELGRPEPTRSAKLAAKAQAIEALFVDLFLGAQAKAAKQITLDLDATDDPLHGPQEGTFFHGDYDGSCSLPLSVFCGRHLLAAKLRRSNIDAAAGAVEEVGRLIAQIRQRWPRVRILLRADRGFAREALMAWCEQNRVDFLLGLARNARLVAEIEAEMAQARTEAEASGKPARQCRDVTGSTLDSGSRRRRVVGKAEWTGGKANPRFVVTSLKSAEAEARHPYEAIHCARGERENRIKEGQLDLFADRTSAATLRANQLRLWCACLAYVLLCALRRIGLAHTEFARASGGTIRLKLLRLGALVTTSVRRIKIAMASGCPCQHEFALAHARLRNADA